MTEPLTREQLILWRRSIEVETLTGWPVEKVALIESALHYEALADDLGNDLKQQASINRAKRDALEARLREVEAERDEMHGRWRIEADAHTDALDRAEKAEAERDAYKADAEALIAAKAHWYERAEKADEAIKNLRAEIKRLKARPW